MVAATSHKTLFRQSALPKNVFEEPSDQCGHEAKIFRRSGLPDYVFAKQNGQCEAPQYEVEGGRGTRTHEEEGRAAGFRRRDQEEEDEEQEGGGGRRREEGMCTMSLQVARGV